MSGGHVSGKKHIGISVEKIISVVAKKKGQYYCCAATVNKLITTDPEYRGSLCINIQSKMSLCFGTEWYHRVQKCTLFSKRPPSTMNYVMLHSCGLVVRRRLCLPTGGRRNDQGELCRQRQPQRLVRVVGSSGGVLHPPGREDGGAYVGKGFLGSYVRSWAA